MKKKKNQNQKGFTMVELLGVIVIMGILFSIAIPSVTKYIKKSSDTSFTTALKSSYEATENYLMSNDTSIIIPVGGTETVNIKDLVDQGYLENIYDTIGNKDLCSNRSESKVKVTRLENSLGGLANYRYDVTLSCKDSGYHYYTYPNDGLMEPAYLAAEKYEKDANLTLPQTFTISTLISKGYLVEDEMKNGDDTCKHANSKVIVTQNGPNILYTVHLQCGSKTFDAKYSV